MRQSKDEISVRPDRLYCKGAAQCVSALVQRQHTAQLAGQSVLARLDIVENGHFGDRELPVPEIHPHAVPGVSTPTGRVKLTSLCTELRIAQVSVGATSGTFFAWTSSESSCGTGRIEFAELPHQYLQLTLLVGRSYGIENALEGRRQPGNGVGCPEPLLAAISSVHQLQMSVLLEPVGGRGFDDPRPDTGEGRMMK
jgi:hypothetical protein